MVAAVNERHYIDDINFKEDWVTCMACGIKTTIEGWDAHRSATRPKGEKSNHLRKPFSINPANPNFTQSNMARKKAN